MEADLQRYYGVDYCDRWRGRLSLRRIRNLVAALPVESAVDAIDRRGKPAWRLEHHLLDDIHMALTHSKKRPAKPHPLRPRGKPKVLNKRRLEAGQKRRQARLRRLKEKGGDR